MLETCSHLPFEPFPLKPTWPQGLLDFKPEQDEQDKVGEAEAAAAAAANALVAWYVLSNLEFSKWSPHWHDDWTTETTMMRIMTMTSSIKTSTMMMTIWNTKQHAHDCRICMKFAACCSFTAPESVTA
jgi:hypothetical protein